MAHLVLSILTIIVNVSALATGLWLGLYVVTRSPRRQIAWLTGLTLWFLSGLFLNVLLALYSSAEAVVTAPWLASILRLWRGTSPDRSLIWLQGWSVIPAVVVWHHATSLMRFPHLGLGRRILLLVGYGAAVAAVALQINTDLLLAASPGNDPLYLTALEVGRLYPFFLVLGLTFVAISVTDLIACARAAATPTLRAQFHILIAATLLGASVALVSIAGSALGLRVPMLLASLQVGAAMVLIGHGVQRYSALTEGRATRSDLRHAAVASALVLVVYVPLTWYAISYLGLPSISHVFVIMAAITTHFLVDTARFHRDVSYYRHDVRQMQASLRRLVRLAGDREEMDQVLALTLESLCSCAQAIFGLILLFEDEDARVSAAYGWHNGTPAFPPGCLVADDVLHLQPGQFAPPLTEAALLMPLYGGPEQLGALILGRPLHGVSYSPDDADQFLHLTDRLGDVILNLRRRAEYAAQVTEGADVPPPEAVRYPVQVAVESVEDALRHLANYGYLGAHPLARLRAVSARVASAPVTHIDLGKAVSGVLTDGIEKLRPVAPLTTNPPSREWYPYVILHDAYVAGVSNRDIMSHLFISHGTFSRTRRAAVRALARALEEMEAAAG